MKPLSVLGVLQLKILKCTDNKTTAAEPASLYHTMCETHRVRRYFKIYLRGHMRLYISLLLTRTLFLRGHMRIYIHLLLTRTLSSVSHTIFEIFHLVDFGK